MNTQVTTSSARTPRREFIKSSGKAIAGASLAGTLAMPGRTKAV
jgi:hypothetical protein